MNRRFVGSLWLCSGVFVSACSGSGGDAAEGATVTDSAGVTIVDNVRPEWEDGAGWSISSEPSLRIGVADGDPEYQLFIVRRAVTGSDGRIYVGNAGSMEVRVFDASGVFSHAMGAEGEGPGEFQDINWITLTPGDSVVVWDVFPRRLSLFTPEGEFVRTDVLEVFHQFERRLPDGRFIVWGGRVITDPPPDGVYRGFNSWSRMTVTEDGEVSDTLETVASAGNWITNHPGGAISFRSIPYDTWPYLEFYDDRYALSERTEYRIDIHRVDGGWMQSIRRPVPNRTVETADMERWIEEQLENVAEERVVETRRTLEEMPTPETFPAHGSLIYDNLGYLWAQGVPGVPELQDRWSVFDPEGRWLGEIDMPSRVNVYEIGADFILGRTTDEFEVEYVVRYDLNRGGEG